MGSIKQKAKAIKHKSGASREDKSYKSAVHAIPQDALIELGKHYAEGAKLHGMYNWEKGLPLSSFLSSASRHMAQLLVGCDDENHDLAVAWNILGFIATKKRIKLGILPGELDDTRATYKGVVLE